jgi:hypothetical protein
LKALDVKLLKYLDLGLEKADDGFTWRILYMQRDADSPAFATWKVGFVDATLTAVKVFLSTASHRCRSTFHQPLNHPLE